MVEADTDIVWDQFNTGSKGARPLSSWSYHNRKLLGRDLWLVTTPHVQSFVLISMLRGQPKTPPSGDDLAVLNYHLNPKHIWRELDFSLLGFLLSLEDIFCVSFCTSPVI